MGQTLTNGIYLPDEGERNSYSGLEVNWRTLDALILTVNGKAAPNIANTWTAAQTFTAGITGDLTGNVTGNLTGTAAKAIADEDGTSIKTGYVNVAGNQTVSGDKSFTGSNTFNNILPNATNTYALGSSSYQWSSVYAQSYFYNGTQWGLDRANTWTGNNTFTSTITTKTNVDRAVAPASDTTYGTIICRDKNNSAMFRMQGTIKTDLSNVWDMMMVAPNNSYITFFKYTISSSSSDRELRLKVTSVVPDDNSTADLGISTNQWKSVYSQTYYYNGTAWGLDKYNIWTNSQVYKLTGTEVGSTTAGYIALYFTDKNNANLGFQRTSVYSDGRTCMSWKVYNTDSNSQPISSSLEYYISKADAKVFAPGENATTDLGTSTYKWKTINGVNPGALGIPQVVTTFEDLTGYVLDGVTENQFPISGLTALDGWLQCRVTHTLGVASFLRMETSYRVWTASDKDCIEEYVLWVPVKAGMSFNKVVCKADDLKIRFHPCMGNV